MRKFFRKSGLSVARLTAGGRDDAGFITFLGKFGMILMYTGAAVVVLGTIRLLWSKARSFRTPKVKGPIALPLHFGAEGVSSPTLPHGGHENRGGVLYYLPVWMFPNGETQRAGPSFPSSLSGLFFRDQDEHAYQPVPSLSRPPSPSSDSILHAPGVVRDGAFDGVNLHSVSGRRPGTPRTTVAPPSPPPPPYQQPSNQSSLRGWGSQFFRGFDHSDTEKSIQSC